MQNRSIYSVGKDSALPAKPVVWWCWSILWKCANKQMKRKCIKPPQWIGTR